MNKQLGVLVLIVSLGLSISSAPAKANCEHAYSGAIGYWDEKVEFAFSPEAPCTLTKEAELIKGFCGKDRMPGAPWLAFVYTLGGPIEYPLMIKNYSQAKATLANYKEANLLINEANKLEGCKKDECVRFLWDSFNDVSRQVQNKGRKTQLSMMEFVSFLQSADKSELTCAGGRALDIHELKALAVENLTRSAPRTPAELKAVAASQASNIADGILTVSNLQTKAVMAGPAPIVGSAASQAGVTAVRAF